MSQDNICVVNGKCFDLTSSECLSHTSMKPTEKTSDKLWIIGAVLGGLAVLIVVVLLVVKVIVKPRYVKLHFVVVLVGKIYSINVRKHRRGNQTWTIQRNWQHMAHKTKK